MSIVTLSADKRHLIVGLTHENIERLAQGKPWSRGMQMLGIDLSIAIIVAKDEAELTRTVMSLDGSATEAEIAEAVKLAEAIRRGERPETVTERS